MSIYKYDNLIDYGGKELIMIKNKLEVIAWTLDDAIEIEKFGADRVELVADLDKGGLSPDLNLVRQVVELVNIPVRVMVRHTDESFIYSNEIMEKHLKYIRELRDIGPEGIVFGSLTSEGKIDFAQLDRVMLAKGTLKLTFHRAFDEIDPSIAESQFDELSKYDVDTLLTSGTKASALEGKELIKKLVDKQSINILPGKSIGIENALEIINYTGVDYIHVGYAVRDSNSTDSKILYNKVEELIKHINHI